MVFNFTSVLRFEAHFVLSLISKVVCFIPGFKSKIVIGSCADVDLRYVIGLASDLPWLKRVFRLDDSPQNSVTPRNNNTA